MKQKSLNPTSSTSHTTQPHRPVTHYSHPSAWYQFGVITHHIRSTHQLSIRSTQPHNSGQPYRPVTQIRSATQLSHTDRRHRPMEQTWSLWFHSSASGHRHTYESSQWCHDQLTSSASTQLHSSVSQFSFIASNSLW